MSTTSTPLHVGFEIRNTTGLAHPHWPVQGGICLPCGAAPADTTFTVEDTAGTVVPAQVNVTATWPDGSIKWVLVILSVALDGGPSQRYTLVVSARDRERDAGGIAVMEHEDRYEVDTGCLQLTVHRTRPNVIDKLRVLVGGRWRMVTGLGNPADLFIDVARGDPRRAAATRYRAELDRRTFATVLEDAGPQRAVIRLSGVHVSPTGDEFAPYTCRIYAYAGSALLRLVHSFVYTGEPRSDFVAAVGLRLGLLLDTVDAYSFGGEHGQGVATKLTQGVYCPRWPRGVLSQGSSRYYTMHKWVDPRANAPVRITEGGRSQGWAAACSNGVRVAMGIRNFWQEYPKELEVDCDRKDLIAYIQSPYGPALDLRRYSDNIYPVMYETPARFDKPPIPFDHERFGARHIGKTTELFILADDGTSDPAAPARTARLFQDRPILTPGGAWIGQTKVFGAFSAMDEAAAPQAARHMRDCIKFLDAEQDYRGWYSLIDYGDVMHSYDPDRDCWAFDEGGYAWLNNESQFCEGLWLAYLSTDDPRALRMAEAMTRHLNDVDMYHSGPLAGHGTRHNVSHWGCRDKERRMTIPENKRYYYFLTADEHTLDLVHLIYDTICEEDPHHEAMDLAVAGTALLMLWETTGEARYGEILRRLTEAYCSWRIDGKGFAKYLDVDLRTGHGHVEPGTAFEQHCFLVDFGPMQTLLYSADLTGSETVRQAVLDWAELLHLPPAQRGRYQQYTYVGTAGDVINMRVAAWAFRQTGDGRFAEYIRRGLTTPIVRFEEAGGDGPLQTPRHRVVRWHYEPRENWDAFRAAGVYFLDDGRDGRICMRHRESHHGVYLGRTMYNLPFGLAAIQQAAPEEAHQERKHLG